MEIKITLTPGMDTYDAYAVFADAWKRHQKGETRGTLRVRGLIVGQFKVKTPKEPTA